MRKLLIADGNEEFRLALMEALQSDFHILCCGSGRQALSLLCREQPDILVLDLMLPELDGVTLLEMAEKEGISLNVLAVSPLISDYVLTCAQRLGIRYLIRKPCGIDAVATRVRDLSQDPRPSRTVESEGRAMLYPLGIGSTLDGCGYCLTAFSMLLQEPRMSMTKVLYPAIAKATGYSQESVERSIRHAIESGWKSGSRVLWLEYFPTAKKRPSNAIFLKRLTEELRLRLE